MDAPPAVRRGSSRCPCSATGTIRRNPDISYLKSEADITALAAVQARLLKHAPSLLKPGGQLVYATCSLEPEEGEAQIRAVLAERSDIALIPIRADELGIRPRLSHLKARCARFPSTPAVWMAFSPHGSPWVRLNPS